MPRLAEIEAHLASIDALLGIVGAMRSLAGIRVQEAQRDLPGIRRYAGTMADAIGSVLPFLDDAKPGTAGAGKSGRAVVLLVAEHGFAGGFNERLLEAAKERLRPGDRLFVLGGRGAAMGAERGLAPDWTHAMATRSAGALETTTRLSSELSRYLASDRVAGIEVLFSRFHQLGHWEVTWRSILPLDSAALTKGRARQAPLHNLPPAVLLERLTAEYVFALLMEAVVESIASENAARFAAMDSATENVKKKLDALHHEANRVRQEEITTELVDLVVGAEAVSQRK